MRIQTLSLALLLSVMITSAASAQNFFRDFVVNNPRSYGPDDPWTTGKIFYNRIGHGGLFYNCDGEECKRHSPYIEWNRQSTRCHRKAPVASTIVQQLCEVRQRIRWGACCDDGSCGSYAESALGSGYFVADDVETVTEPVLVGDTATPTPPAEMTQLLQMDPVPMPATEPPVAMDSVSAPQADDSTVRAAEPLPELQPSQQSSGTPRIGQLFRRLGQRPRPTRDEQFRMLR